MPLEAAPTSKAARGAPAADKHEPIAIPCLVPHDNLIGAGLLRIALGPAPARAGESLLQSQIPAFRKRQDVPAGVHGYLPGAIVADLAGEGDHTSARRVAP